MKVVEDESSETLANDHRFFPKETYLPSLEENIKCGNSLINFDIFETVERTRENIEKINPFDWKSEFREQMKRKFDVVIGNPPYILLQDQFRDDDQLNYFNETYEVASYKIDTYHLFFERIGILLKKGGKAGIITPSNYLTNNYLESLRRLLLEKYGLNEIIILDQSVFPGASVDTAITIFGQANQSSPNFLIERGEI